MFKMPINVPNLPLNRGTSTFRNLWYNVYALQGWRVMGEIPNIEKAVVIGAPHTSNMDAWWTLQFFLFTGIKINIIGKESLYQFPFKSFWDWFGLIPLDRSNAKGFTESVIDLINARKKIWLGIGPEGSRKGVTKWKSGFWRIARGANVPIILVTFDYQNKAIRWLGVIEPTDDYEKDLADILQRFKGITPRHPKNLSAPLKQNF